GVTGRAMHGEVEDHNLQIVSYSLPSADDDAYTVVHDRQLTGENVLDNDVAGTDAIAAVPIDGGPTDQGGVVDLAADGTFTYTPPAGFVGADTFTYELTDGVTTLEATV